ncbi:hypothetical protein CANCADRAFT_13468, partial [Tortispora caseinolytica NRRL Y-17796]
KLVVFDMDSTLIKQEVIDMIAAKAGIEEKVAGITELAMRGEIDFNESLRQRASLLKGITGDVFEDLKKELILTPGGPELVQRLKQYGVKTAVLSGGFIPLAKYVQEQLGLDYAFANSLAVVGGKLSGEVEGEIVNANRKAELLQEIAAKEGIELKDTVAIGDGANDLVMMSVAGFGIAFNAKPIVQQKAPSRLNGDSLLDVLYMLGFT